MKISEDEYAKFDLIRKGLIKGFSELETLTSRGLYDYGIKFHIFLINKLNPNLKIINFKINGNLYELIVSWDDQGLHFEENNEINSKKRYSFIQAINYLFNKKIAIENLQMGN
jgi:hypothetical protein